MVSLSSALSLVSSICLLARQVDALSAAEWRSRTVYQIMTDRFALTDGSTPACDISIGHYCGGSLEGIVNNLDYIQGLGFDAIWISPIAQQIPNSTAVGEAYHGYWPSDLFSVQSPTALTSLVTALHNRGMALMLDLVVNDVAWPLKTSTSQFDPTIGESGNGTQDGLYGVLDRAEDYHPRCVIDYDNVTSVQNCWLSDPSSVVLVDLNTQSARIRKLHQDWIASLISTYKVDGLRIDAAKHVEMDFWAPFGAAAGVFMIGEVLDGSPERTHLWQNGTMDGILNYPMWYPLFRAFTSSSGSMKDLSDMILTVNYYFPDPSLLGTFVSNHDQPRPRSYMNDTALLQNLFAFPFLSTGIPITYYGDEQSGSDGAADPMNREALWQLGSSAYDATGDWYSYHTKLNAIRRAAAAYSLNFYTNATTPLAPLPTAGSHALITAKGPLLSIYSNLGSTSSPSSLSFTSNYAANSTVIELMTCTKVVVGSAGKMALSIKGGAPQVYLPICAVTIFSGLCPTIASGTTCAQRVASRSDPSR